MSMTRAWMAAAVWMLALLPAIAQKPYKVLEQWKVAGTGTWDALVADGENHLLYVAHGTRVEVVDTRTGKSVGAVTGLKGVHGISLDPDGEVGYISDGAGKGIAVFDRKSYGTLDVVPAGTDPDAIAFEPDTRTVWAFNAGSQDVTVMDTRDRAVLATVKLPGKPGFAVADGHGSLFVAIAETNTVLRLSAGGKNIAETWSMTNCNAPGSLAYDAGHTRLFAACEGKSMAVLDARSGQVLATPALPVHAETLVYVPRGEMILASGADGTLSVVDARPGKGFGNVELLPTAAGAKGMAYQAQADRAFVAAGSDDAVTVLMVGRK